MNSKILKLATFVIFEIACFIIIGYLDAGSAIFDIRRTDFIFTIFGLNGIILFNLLE